jgi:hypothetical protein
MSHLWYHKLIFQNKKNIVAPLVNVIRFWGSLMSRMSMRSHAPALAAAGLPPSEGNHSGCSMPLQSVARLPLPLNGVDPLQCRPVNGAAMALTADDLRCQVLMCAHERHGPRVRRLRVELHRRWAAGEPRVALGRLPAATRQDAQDEGHRVGGIRSFWSRRKKVVSHGGVACARCGVARAHRPRCLVKETTPAVGRQR